MIGINYDFSAPQLQIAIDMVLPIQGDIFNVSFGLNHLYGYANQNPLIFIDPFGLAPSSCIAKLKGCRVKCSRQLFKASACFITCEERYGALSNCTDDDEDNENDDKENTVLSCLI